MNQRAILRDARKEIPGLGQIPGTIRVDTCLMLHNVAEAMEIMFDYAGRSRREVLEFARDQIDCILSGDEGDNRALILLASALALNGR